MKTWKKHNGYLYCWYEGKRKLHHRFIWEQAHGPVPSGSEIDHINGVRTDNRLENLRLVTRQENMQNTKIYNTNKSGVTGVSWCKRKQRWRAVIMGDAKQTHLGYFGEWFEAVCARMSANNIYGYHPNHGRR